MDTYFIEYFEAFPKSDAKNITSFTVYGMGYNKEISHANARREARKIFPDLKDEEITVNSYQLQNNISKEIYDQHTPPDSSPWFDGGNLKQDA